MGTHEHAVERAAVSSRWGDEDGFTIMESIVGLVLFVVLFASAATTMQLSIRNQKDVRARQQAVALATQSLEDARALAWSELALSTAPASDGVRTNGSVVFAAPFGLPDGDEPLVVDPIGGEIDPFVAGADVIDSQSFDLRRYVTDSGSGVRRLIVVIEWTTYQTAHTYVATTQIAEVST